MSSMVVPVATFCDLRSPDSLDPFLNSSFPEFFSYVQSMQSKTGYYNGKLVVTLDEALTPTNTKPKLTVYNKEADKTTSFPL